MAQEVMRPSYYAVHRVTWEKQVRKEREGRIEVSLVLHWFRSLALIY